jgi:hypothetical protein
MQQGLRGLPANFPGKRGNGGDAAAIFADFNGRPEQEFLEAAPQLFGKVYASIIN